MKNLDQKMTTEKSDVQSQQPLWFVLSLGFLLAAIIGTVCSVYIEQIRPFLCFFVPLFFEVSIVLFLTSVLALCIRAWKSFSFKYKVLLIVTLSVCVCMLEFYLLGEGYKPGYICGRGDYAAVDVPLEKVQDTHEIICDEYGVTKYNSDLSGGLCSRINCQGFNSKFEFDQKTIDSLKATGRTTIALIGDSYGFGNEAAPGRSFADSLEKTQKYAIFNFSVSGTDGPQYAAVVKEYIRDGGLKFDRVIISICGANDLFQWPKRKLTPGTPLLFTDGTTNYYSQRDGKIFCSIREACEGIRHDATVFHMPGGAFFGRSVVATQAARFLQMIATVVIAPVRFMGKENYDGFMKLAGMGISSLQRKVPFPTKIDSYLAFPITSDIEEIKNDCRKAGVPVTCILVPGKEMVRDKKVPQIEGIISLDASILSASDYIRDGGSAHPNSTAHEQIAGMIDTVLDSILQSENTQHLASQR